MLFQRFSVLLGLLLSASLVHSAERDWPMWRGDAYRSAATDHDLPVDLSPLWRLRFSPRVPAWDDPLNLDLMTFDRIFEPVVLGQRLFLAFNDQDKLVAYSTTTGEELWTYFTDAPVRFSPAGWQDKLYLAADDGCLHCLDAATGKLLWKLRGGPSERKALGNKRLISAWPARGGPVVRDGIVYFAASIWPFMGTFIYAVNAETGEVIWVNDSTGPQYIKQPHSAPAFAGVAPQGFLCTTENTLVVPGGRSVPAVFDRHTGEQLYFEVNEAGKGTGGAFVATNETEFYVHTRLKGTRQFDLTTGLKTAFMPNEPVLQGGKVYTAEMVENRPSLRCYGPDKKVEWELEVDGTGDLILAGKSLYAASRGKVTVASLPLQGQPARIQQVFEVEGDIQRLLAADHKLFAVTLEGDVIALGTPAATAAPIPQQRVISPLQVTAEAASQVRSLLSTENAQGYALCFGAEDGEFIDALASATPFEQLVIVDPDVDRVHALRKRLDAAQLYGRVTAHVGTPTSFTAPPYIAHMVFLSPAVTTALSADPRALGEAFQSVRPYGGELHLLTAPLDLERTTSLIRQLKLDRASVEAGGTSVIVRRVGALPGSGDWTHQNGNVANTLMSADGLVKAPLGLLWFGGTSNMDVLPRHGHGPPEQVIGGRLFIEGINSLSARDVYTGRLLWKRQFQDLGSYGVYYDETYAETPLDPAYNQVHIPGANGRGTNYVVTADRVYIAEGNVCHVLNPVTGELIQDIALPKADDGLAREWGYIAVYDNVLIGGQGFAAFQSRHDLTAEDISPGISGKRVGFGVRSLDNAGSAALIGFDRHTGEQLWKVNARHSFWHNGIVAGKGRVYCLDRNPQQVEDALRRRGKSVPNSYRIVTIDAQTGKHLWETSQGIFGTWLGYSEEHDLLLQAGAAASDRLLAEVGKGMAVYRAETGEVVWSKPDLAYAGPCILRHDEIITNTNSYSESAGAFSLLDGSQKLVPNPITGQLEPWRFTRAYGCNSIIASENLLTFRSGAAGFYDLTNDSGTGNLGGFRSGCTSNLVVANGVLNAPDYTRTCSCGYQNQTSLALVHMPELEYWTVHTLAKVQAEGQRLQRIGLNFGAPGDRRDQDGLLWLEHPSIAGESVPLQVEFQGEPRFFNRHSSTVSSSAAPWVHASGVHGITGLKLSLNLQEVTHPQEGVSIRSAEDDVEENSAGSVDSGSSDLELIDDDGPQLVGLRFNGINVARGGKIRSAYIQFTCDEPTDARTQLKISIEDVGNAERFSAAKSNVSARNRSAQTVTWDVPAWNKGGEADAPQRTPDLKELVQAVVNRSDWEPGNALALIIEGTGKRVAAASSGKGDAKAPRLIIDADPAPATTASDVTKTPYRLKLYFSSISSEPATFDVLVDGETVLTGLVLDRSRPETTTLVREIPRVLLGSELNLHFLSRSGTPALSGISIEVLND